MIRDGKNFRKTKGSYVIELHNGEQKSVWQVQGKTQWKKQFRLLIHGTLMAAELPTASQERNRDATVDSSKNMLT